MLSNSILALAGMVAAAQAIMFQTPTNNSDVDFTKSFDVTWTSVNTDPSNFELVLVNQADVNNPITVAAKVTTSDNKFTVSGLSGVVQGATYRFNAESVDPQNTGILAQTQMFHAAKVGSAESSSSSSSSSTSTTGTSSPTGTGAGVSSTKSTKTSSGTSTPTGAGAASGTGANPTSTGGVPVTSGNAAAGLKTFGVAGSVFAGLLMLF